MPRSAPVSAFTLRPSAVLMCAGLMALLLVSGCGGGGSSSSTPGGGSATGGLVVQMHDHPIATSEPVEHVYVTIEGVEVARMVDGQEVRETVASTPGQYDLLELQNGVEAVLGGGSFPPGDYHWIRLDVAKDSKHDIKHLPADQLANYIVVGGIAYPLVVPSGEQTGIKLGHRFTIHADVTTTLTIDFDVRKSVHPCGHNHVWRLKPRLRVVATETGGGGGGGGGGTTGLSGAVSTSDGSGLPSSTVVSAQQGGVEVASAMLDPTTNTYSIAGLPDGTYDLVAIAPGYQYDTETGVVVTGGSAAGSHDFVMVPAGAGALYGTIIPASENETVVISWNGFTVATVGADPTTGEYVVDGLPAGDFLVTASDADTGLSLSDTATVTAGSATQLDFYL